MLMTTQHLKLEVLEAPDKVQRVVSALHDYIINGNLKPGTELPPESEMAKQLKVSKFSMREALRIAQAQGLVEISQGRRTRVADISVDPLTDIMHLLLRRSENVLLELTEARKCLESSIVRRAAERAEPEHIEAMQMTIEALKHHLDDVEYCVEKDLEFHNILVQASNNRVFEIMLAPLAEFLKQSRLETLHVSGVQKAIDEHSLILDAIRKRDPDLAEADMKHHLETAEQNIKTSAHPEN